MKLSYVENILTKGALRANRPVFKIFFTVMSVALLCFGIVSLFFFFTQRREILLADAFIGFLGAIVFFAIKVYQSIIQKIYSENKK